MRQRILMTGAAMPVLLCCSSLAFVVGCNRGSEPKQSGQTEQAASPTMPMTVRGTVVSDSANALVLKSDTGDVAVTMVQPFRLYTRVPSDLSHVKEGSFIGVTTVKQPDGSERATEIHIFPEELRGLGEGSRMMAPPRSGGTASQSRMSNGSVSSAKGSSLVVQYAGGSQAVTVPSNTPVSELRVASRSIAVGDQVAVLVKKAPDGSLSADKALSTAR